MKIFSIYILFVINVLSLSAQTPPNHRTHANRLLSAADSLTAKAIYADAYHLYHAAKAADPDKIGIADAGIARMLRQINAEKATADSLQALYRLRSKQLQKINEYLGFISGRAWIYNDSVQRFALIDQQGDLLSDYIFEQPHPFANSNDPNEFLYTIAKHKGRWVVVNRLGSIVSEPFDWRIKTENGKYMVKMGEYWFIYNDKFKEEQGPFLQIDDEQVAFWVKSTEGTWGLMDKEKYRWLARPQYSDISFFEGGFALVQKNDKWGIINESGKEVIAPRYDYLSSFNGNHAIFKKNNQYGIINKQSKELSNSDWTNIIDCSQGLFAVQQNDKWGLVDSLGNSRCAAKFFKIGRFDNGRAVAAANEDRWGIIDSKGEWIGKQKFPQIDSNGYRDSLLWVKDGKGKWGLLDWRGEVVVEPIYDQTKPFSGGRAWVELDKKWGLINKKGNVVVEIKYEDYRDNGGDWIAVKRSGVWGFIDKQGKELTAPKFQSAEAFSDSLAAVSLNNRAGYIHLNGDWLLTRNFIRSQPFSEQMAWVSERTDEGERYGLVDTKGDWLILPQFEKAEAFRNGRAWVSKLGSSFYIDRKGVVGQ